MRPVRIPAAAIVFAIVLSFAVSAARHAGWVGTIGPPGLVDFDSFYVAARLVLDHHVATAYRFADFAALQRAIDPTTTSFMPWAYPPQYDLLVAPLAVLPRSVAYIVFVGSTLTAFLLTLRHLARSAFAPVLMLIYLPVLVNVSTGQNGFLTASLIGIACALLLRGSAWAGIPLGLLIIKPQLAVALALWVLLARQWRTAAVAVTTILVTSLIATAVLGTGIWAAFADGLSAAGAFMARGVYPFYRMVSVYAAARSGGATLLSASVLQATIGVAALAAVAVAHRRLSTRAGLGVAVVATVSISPYAYDYDLPILGVGIALVWPSLRAAASRVDAIVLAGVCFVSGSIGFVRSFWATEVDPRDLLTLAGPGLAFATAWLFRVLVRAGPAPAATGEAAH